MLLKAKNYYQQNKDRLHAKINCECGSEYSFAHKHDHLKTKKHIKWQNDQELEEVVDV